jgi:antitoxin FitA
MSDITIRDIDDDLKQRLKQRAAQHGQSMQAEAHDILRDALSTEPSAAVPANIADAIRAIVEPLGGIELEPFPRQPVREPPTFE